jgi:RNA polymerase sigma-70 factor (ECF subfamily)
VRDVDALRDFVKGDDDAFQLIVDRYRRPVLAYLSRYCKRADCAADMTQETFLALFRHLIQEPDVWLRDGTLGPFIFTIAAGVAIDELRHETMRLERESIAVLSPVSALFREEVDVSAREIVLDVRRALAALPLEVRDVALLYFLDGHTTPEVATMLGLPKDAVRGRIARARQLLSTYLKRYSKGANNDIRPAATGRAGEPPAGHPTGLH